MKKKRLTIGIVVFVLGAAGGAFLLTQQRGGTPEAIAAADSTAVGNADTSGSAEGKDAGDEEKPVPVETALAAPRDLPATFHATGSLEARRQIDLIAKAQGQVVKLVVEEGDYVEKGQVLLEIEHREEELLLEKASVQARTALRELERSEELLEKGLDSDRAYEEKKEAAEILTLERDLAEVRLQDRVVAAPFAGLVTRREVELGQTVNPGDPLVGLADVNPLEVRLFLPERVVQDLAVGQPVEIRPDVDAGGPLPGSVLRIAPSVDPATSTVKVTLRVADGGGSTRVGSFVRARITTDVHKDCVAVPKRALVSEAGAAYLFVAEADSARRVPVVTGYADDDFVEITEGVAPGQAVITVGQGGLRTGSRVRDLTAERARIETPSTDPGNGD